MLKTLQWKLPLRLLHWTFHKIYMTCWASSETIASQFPDACAGLQVTLTPCVFQSLPIGVAGGSLQGWVGRGAYFIQFSSGSQRSLAASTCEEHFMPAAAAGYSLQFSNTGRPASSWHPQTCQYPLSELRVQSPQISPSSSQPLHLMPPPQTSDSQLYGSSLEHLGLNKPHLLPWFPCIGSGATLCVPSGCLLNLFVLLFALRVPQLTNHCIKFSLLK